MPTRVVCPGPGPKIAIQMPQGGILWAVSHDGQVHKTGILSWHTKSAKRQIWPKKMCRKLAAVLHILDCLLLLVHICILPKGIRGGSYKIWISHHNLYANLMQHSNYAHSISIFLISLHNIPMPPPHPPILVQVRRCQFEHTTSNKHCHQIDNRL